MKDLLTDTLIFIGICSVISYGFYKVMENNIYCYENQVETTSVISDSTRTKALLKQTQFIQTSCKKLY
jgi:hypothetical protein